MNLRKIVNLTLFSMGLLLSTSCNNGVQEGTIIKKEYQEARTYYAPIIIPHTITTGKITTTYFTTIPFKMYDDEDYIIEIKGLDKHGDTNTRSVFVDAQRFDTVNLGDYFCIDGNCETEDLAVRQKRVGVEEFKKNASPDALKEYKNNLKQVKKR